jgi:ATP-dependent Zn protease
VLLYGPPGTGKTLLAKAMAGESDVTFIAAEGNQFLKKFVGEGAEKVHELFNTARKYAPSILFIDEIDVVGKERKGESGSETSADVLTAFLTEMDGFKVDTDKPVFVLAATNYDIDPDSNRKLDAALLRRFDRKILVDLPNKEERARYLRLKMSGNKNLQISDEQVDSIVPYIPVQEPVTETAEQTDSEVA